MFCYGSSLGPLLVGSDFPILVSTVVCCCVDCNQNRSLQLKNFVSRSKSSKNEQLLYSIESVDSQIIKG